MRPGLHRIVAPLPAVVSAVEADGWRVGVAAEATSTEAFYAAVAAALDFPDWFGANLDALWDCLTDLSEPTVLVLPAWRSYARVHAERWSRIEQVLRDRAELDPPFAVVLL